MWFAHYAFFPATPPEQCEPIKLLVTLEDLPQGAVINVARQPAPEYQQPSAEVGFNVEGHSGFQGVVWHKAIWTAWGNFEYQSNFSFKRGPDGVREDIPESLRLLSLQADESHIGCGMTVIGWVCSFAARYTNIDTWLHMELDSDNRVDEFARLVELIDARLRSCGSQD